MRGLCLCKTCQKISGGAGNLFIGIDADAFRYTRGEPRRFAHPDANDAPTREFCSDCGVHIRGSLVEGPGGMIVKVGTLDDPAVFEGPAGIPAFARVPGR